MNQLDDMDQYKKHPTTTTLKSVTTTIQNGDKFLLCNCPTRLTLSFKHTPFSLKLDDTDQYKKHPTTTTTT
ncbi:hypothetical protein J6590_017617 [Homalodisca vitripennis]|nr:hypothetical protein J6590_017617 [Homalodisca vitripennis]